MQRDEDDTPAWREAQDIKALPVQERISLAVHNSHLGSSNLNEKDVEAVRIRVRPKT